ncbi:retron system putative HNH endonuclease [Desulfovibrio inopinatus]|uniref:retron system putative HNH endonuclease n=1 Tax=Desulfovibrio inopinatus TaxID=102109 RepID=UPI0003FA685D|nr:retron system putative HNH endonuclease [Desulfovibrio inopinatus]
MKHIVKGAEPEVFTEWKALANEDWQPTYDDLRSKEKKAVKKALMQEQGYICCYCERRLVDNDSHIEHFHPQHRPEVDALDFNNMLCSCQAQLERGKPRHCGNLKGDWFDEQLLISPLDPSCQTRFRFTGDGRITPAHHDDNAAAETIDRLGLDIPKLREMRSKAIEGIMEGLPPEEIQNIAAALLSKDTNGFFIPFWTTIRYLFT